MGILSVSTNPKPLKGLLLHILKTITLLLNQHQNLLASTVMES